MKEPVLERCSDIRLRQKRIDGFEKNIGYDLMMKIILESLSYKSHASQIIK